MPPASVAQLYEMHSEQNNSAITGGRFFFFVHPPASVAQLREMESNQHSGATTEGRVEFGGDLKEGGTCKDRVVQISKNNIAIRRGRCGRNVFFLKSLKLVHLWKEADFSTPQKR